MRWRAILLVVTAAAAAVWYDGSPAAIARTGAAGPMARSVMSAGIWRKAIEVPGSAALNADGSALVFSVSCRAGGNCAVAGYYNDRSEDTQAFVANERNGVWRKAIEVPGSGALNAGGLAIPYSVSCGSAGNCAVGGFYTDDSGNSQAFVASERSGTWRRAVEVPGSGALNVGGVAQVNSVSCGSAGNCAVGGYYKDGSDNFQAFVASERSGTWGNAIEMPGSAALNLDGHAAVNSVSCGSAGNCTAGGYYLDGSARFQAFVASEKNGHWQSAIEVPVSGALNLGGEAQADSVSCPSAGNCAAGGFYTDDSSHEQAFVASERNGVWRKAIEVPGFGALNAAGTNDGVSELSCASAGNCAAGGNYTDRSGHWQAFVASEKNGAWRKAIEVPRSGILNAGGTAAVSSLSCGSAGNCAAGGFYKDRSGHFQAFVASETNGAWGNAIEVPGSGALNTHGSAFVYEISCASAGNCVAGGSYTDRSGQQAFVVSQASR